MFSFRSPQLNGAVVAALAGVFVACRAYQAFAAETPSLDPAPALARTDVPAWPYPRGVPDEAKEDGTLFHVPGSRQAFTFTQINGQRATIDWFPERHPVPPAPVISGREGAYNACGQCHLIDGGGKPDTSDLRGLPVAYMLQQLADMRDDHRHASISGAPLAKMVEIAKALPLDDARQASEYFHSIRPVKRLRLVESDVVPVTHPAAHAVQKVDPSGATEPIGTRIIEVPQSFERTLLRDPSSDFIAYVPVGSIRKGKALATSGGGGRTLPCASCHGEDLRGSGDEFPSIAGRSPTAMARQLYDFKSGTRDGKNAVAMRPVVSRLTDADIVNLTAYLASLEP
ncbi:c-type cytochrome [Sphingomonas sp. RHCKR7]|uniref:c-type cytochrome n=1 Tax=Sphingomonas folli TaxID=2862497 RepID=UPI001CA57900|nr:c-type cytochrome [Sphingomonas folli]MBW6526425.1 c-type cytochrome [Sphingomonas folli]